MVQIVSNLQEFKAVINSPRLVVIDFFATWCGPCRQISPFIEQLVGKYPNVKFVKVDVDVASDVAQQQEISAMPTFQYFYGGQMVEEFKGADKNKLEQLIIQYDVPPKKPSEMTIKELKVAIVHTGLASKTLGFSEKHEYVELLEAHYNK